MIPAECFKNANTNFPQDDLAEPIAWKAIGHRYLIVTEFIIAKTLFAGEMENQITLE